MNDENTKFIEYLDEFKNMSELTKDNYNMLLKEIENNYLINTVPELNNEKKIKINKQITPTDITFFIEESSSYSHVYCVKPIGSSKDQSLCSSTM